MSHSAPIYTKKLHGMKGFWIDSRGHVMLARRMFIWNNAISAVS